MVRRKRMRASGLGGKTDRARLKKLSQDIQKNAKVVAKEADALLKLGAKEFVKEFRKTVEAGHQASVTPILSASVEKQVQKESQSMTNLDEYWKTVNSMRDENPEKIAKGLAFEKTYERPLTVIKVTEVKKK